MIGIAGHLATRFELKADEKFDVLLGSKEDRGMLRLKRNKKNGVVSPRIGKGSGATFALGYIERFGTEPEKKQFCFAEIIDADTLQIVLPKWSDDVDV